MLYFLSENEKKKGNILMKNKQLFGSLLLVLIAMIWGTAFVFQRIGMEHIEPVTFTAVRMAVAAVFIGLFSKISDMKKNKDTKPQTDRKYTLSGGIFCGIFLSLASIAQQAGIVYTSVGKAGFITSLYILLVPVINLLIFRQKSSFRVWCGVILGIVGMYLLCVKEDFSLTYGDTMIAVCALLFSGHILCCDRFSKKADPVKLSFIQFVTTAVISTAAALIMETPTWEKIISAVIPLLYCGIVSGGIGYTLQMVAQKYTKPTIASLLMSLESVFAVLAGALILGERMTLQELLGCMIMFAAIVWVQIPLPKKK